MNVYFIVSAINDYIYFQPMFVKSIINYNIWEITALGVPFTETVKFSLFCAIQITNNKFGIYKLPLINTSSVN